MKEKQCDWRLEIASTGAAKQELSNVDKQKIFSFTIPKLAATQKAVLEAQNRLGFEFDDDYAEFLCFGNGWDSFALSDGDLFGTGDYPTSRRYLEAVSIMNLIAEGGVFKDTDIKIGDAFPFCACEHSSDLYLMKKRHVTGQPRVFWFAGYLVDTFPSFLEFFRSMRAYDHKNVEYLQKKRG
jgi:hypothetical protein